MAEASLKLGGSWATKEGSLLGFNDENGNYKPIPFDFTRATTATRVNRDGLIEEVQSGVPRIDFTDSDGSLLLEPQRTNLVQRSEEFDNAYWSNTRVSINANTTETLDPSGDNNSELITQSASDTNGGAFFRFFSFTAASYTYSIFAKMKDVSFINIAETASAGGTIRRSWFNIENGTLGTTNAAHTAKIESYGNGWYRCSVTFTASAGSYSILNYISDVDASVNAVVSEGLYFYGAQLEAGSYPTSYIKTSGSAVTRNADATNKTDIESLIGQTEGTMFIEFNSTEDAPQNMNLINFNNSTQASVLIAKRTSGALRAQVFAGGSAVVDINSAIVSGTTKAAFAYKSGDTVLYVNGVAISNSNTFTFNGTLSELIFPSHQAYFNYGHKYSVNQAMLYKTRLTDTELEELTTI